MKHIADVKELQEFQLVKNYATDSSYIKALEGSSRMTLQDIDSTLKTLQMVFNGFKNERKGTSFTRWQQLDTHFSDWFIRDYLDNDNVDGLDVLLDERKEVELYSKKSYRVTVTKYNSYYMVNVETFAHIILLEGTIQWLDDEQAKLMIARKINAIHKK